MRGLRDLFNSSGWWVPFAFAWAVITGAAIARDGWSGLIAGAVTAAVGTVVVIALRRRMLRH